VWRGVERGSALLGICAALAGCASLPQPKALAPVQTAPRFEINARLLASDGQRRLSSQLRWSHNERTRILMTTPLGQALASIESGAEGARLTTAEGHSYSADSLDALVRRGLGWSLPLQQLPWWINGRAAPGDFAAMSDRDGLQQDGWTVQFDGRDALGRPARLDVECTAEPCRRQGSGSLHLRVLIDQWTDSP